MINNNKNGTLELVTEMLMSLMVFFMKINPKKIQANIRNKKQFTKSIVFSICQNKKYTAI